MVQSLLTQTASAMKEQLLKAIAEDLKLPLLRVARFAELGTFDDQEASRIKHFKTIEHNADIALQLIDSYLLGLELAESQQSLELGPVSIGAILENTAHQLSDVAKEHNVDIKVTIRNHQPLVMGHARALQVAFLNLGSTLISAQPTSAKSRNMTLAAYGRGKTMLAGIYGDQEAISFQDWHRGQRLYGHARQPISSLSTNGAGLFIADTIFSAMTMTLRPSSYNHQNGIAAMLPLSQQLQLV